MPGPRRSQIILSLEVWPVLQSLDFYFRWAVAIEESLLNDSVKPPLPKPSNECGLYIADVRLQSFWATLAGGGPGRLTGVTLRRIAGLECSSRSWPWRVSP